MCACRVFPVALILVVISACAGEPAPDSGADARPAAIDTGAVRAEIAAANKRWDEDMLKGDPKAIAATFTEDGARHPAGKPTVRGRAAIEAAMKADMDSNRYTASSDVTDELIVAGDYVIEIGTWSSAATTKAGKPNNLMGRYMALWKRDSTGAWKIHRDMGSETPAKK